MEHCEYAGGGSILQGCMSEMGEAGRLVIVWEEKGLWLDCREHGKQWETRAHDRRAS